MSQQQQSPPAGNLLVFFLLSILIFVSFQQLRNIFYPPPAQKADDPKAKVAGTRAQQEYVLPDQPKPTPKNKLLTIGATEDGSRFNLRVALDPFGAGVRSVHAVQFRAADNYGRPLLEQLELVQAEANADEPSHLLFHFDPNAATADRPLDTLGKTIWHAEPLPNDEVDGKKRQRVRFTAEANGLKFTKTYAVVEGDYHLGLTVSVTRGKDAKKEARLRYQLTGAKGLPVEGKWYTHVFRNAMIATETENGHIERDLQELPRLALWGGGNEIRATERAFIRYAGVAVQYFASVIVVAQEQQKQDRHFLATARPTLEHGVLHGRVRGIPQGEENFFVGERLVVMGNDGRTVESVFVPPHLRGPRKGVTSATTVAIRYRNLNYDPVLKEAPKLALDIRVGPDAESTHAMWEDDITVRVTTRAIDLKPDETVTHEYLLYNGPVKPSLLGHLTGEAKVAPALVRHYVDDLNLNTLTDYQSQGGLGWFSYYTGLTWLVIRVTNLIHFILSYLYYLIPNLGLCILVLTVLVRGVMFPLSRKQAIMGLKMQALAPEMKKLQEKYGDDKHGMQLAQWALFNKHGVNPLGSCWVLLLQMPIFMGLWYALQESITFRLGSFPPTWIVNLAAPDMLLHWGEGIPMISRPSDYGSFLYLGPYFNLLPIVAVAFMYIQQQMMTPPPIDEQQQMNQTVMKFMMIFFGLVFYKVAAGLCVYYIATTLWGFAERAMLPKQTLDPVKVDLEAAGVPATATAGSDQVTTTGPGTVTTSGKKKKKKKGPETAAKEEPASGFGKWRQGWAEWWKDVLEQARKK